MGKYSLIETFNLECGAIVNVYDKEETNNFYVYVDILDVDGSTILLNKESFARNQWNACKGYYTYKTNKLLDDENSVTLNEPYIMFEVNDCMYALTDTEYKENHRIFRRSCIPLGFTVEESYVIDLLTFGGLHMFTYPMSTLVYRFDKFYLNGKIVGTYEEVRDYFEKQGIEIKDYDIDSGDHRVVKYFKDKMVDEIKEFVTANYSGGVE